MPKRIITQDTKFTGRSLGWRILLVAAMKAAEQKHFRKAEQLASKSLNAAERYLGGIDLEMVPVILLLSDLYRELNELENRESALELLALALQTAEPDDEEHSRRTHVYTRNPTRAKNS